MTQAERSIVADESIPQALRRLLRRPHNVLPTDLRLAQDRAGAYAYVYLDPKSGQWEFYRWCAAWSELPTIREFEELSTSGCFGHSSERTLAGFLLVLWVQDDDGPIATCATYEPSVSELASAGALAAEAIAHIKSRPDYVYVK